MGNVVAGTESALREFHCLENKRFADRGCVWRLRLRNPKPQSGAELFKCLSISHTAYFVISQRHVQALVENEYDVHNSV
jgi:hypothetical protein